MRPSDFNNKHANSEHTNSAIHRSARDTPEGLRESRAQTAALRLFERRNPRTALVNTGFPDDYPVRDLIYLA